jgi:hypothetical protein
MPREIYSGTNYVALSTTANSYVDLTGLVPTGEVYLLRVLIINNNSTSSATVYASARNSSNAVLYPLLAQTTLAPYEGISFRCLLTSGQKLSIAQTTTTSNVTAVVVDGVRQYP